MSGVTLYVDYNDQQIQRVLTRLIETGQNPAPIMKDIAAYGEASTRNRFKDGVAPDGTPWKPSRRVQEHGGKTLVASEILWKTIANNYGNDFAEWGTSVTYAAIHQFGGEIRPKNKKSLFFKLPDGSGRHVKKVTIPARPYLGISADDEENILDLIVSNINESIS